MESGVYFIKNNNNGLIKIGKSNNIKNRFKRIKDTFKFLGLDNGEIYLVDSIFCKNYSELESDLHNMFKEFRKAGEWFSISELMVKDCIDRIDLNKYNVQKKIIIKKPIKNIKINNDVKILSNKTEADEICAFMDGCIGSYDYCLSECLNTIRKIIDNDCEFIKLYDYICDNINIYSDKKIDSYNRPKIFCKVFDNVLNIYKNMNIKDIKKYINFQNIIINNIETIINCNDYEKKFWENYYNN